MQTGAIAERGVEGVAAEKVEIVGAPVREPEAERELAAAGVPVAAPRGKPNSLLIEVDGVRTSFRRFPYPLAKPDLLHRLKALTYFEDAESEPEPRLLRAAG